MKTNEKYFKYISNRTNGTSYDNPGELYAITAVDYYGAVGDFYLLQFFSHNCFLFRCASSTDGNPKSLAIKGIRSFEHKLQDVFKPEVVSEDKAQKNDEAYFDREGVCAYDRYYDDHYPELKEYNQRLAQALENIKFDDSLPVYVCGYYIENIKSVTGKKAVWYAVQQRATKVVRMEQKESNDNAEIGRILDVKGVRRQQLNTLEAITIADCFGNKGKVVFVPLVDETLSSMFFGTTTWREILADSGTDMCCQINGVPCKCIQVQMNMDVYNNVFCTTTDENGKTKCTLIHNALGVQLNQKPEPSIKQPQPPPHPLPKPKPNPKNAPDSIETANSDSGSSEITIQTTDSTDRGNDIQVRPNKHIDIIKDSNGFSFDETFKQCLTGAEILVLEHSHLSKWFQLFWFEYFIKTCLRAKCFKRFVLITNPLDEIEEEDHQNIKNTMKRIESKLKKKNILFEIVYMPGCHDRILYTSSDWMVTFGYGLDFLRAPNSDEQYEGFDDKECKATTTTYIDFKDKNDFIFKTYSFKHKYKNFPTLS